MNETRQSIGSAPSSPDDLDVAVIGAGISGMYAVHRFRRAGLTVRAFDEAGDVGGTWWWNCYPGARVDSPGAPFYCYTFDRELVNEWEWAETQPDQPTILAYLRNFAEKYDIRRDVQFETRVENAEFDESTNEWVIELSTGERVRARFLVSAAGTLSAANLPNIPGIEDFAGPLHHTGRWPQDGCVDFTDKRVAVVGTGSSGVQVIPNIAKDASQLYVLQRTPQFVLPARNRPLDPALAERARDEWPDMRDRLVKTGRALPMATKSALDVSDEERRATYDAAWVQGGMAVRECYRDHMTNLEANEILAGYVRDKIVETIDAPTIAEKLLPTYIFGTKRLILGTDYYETYNRDNVRLLDIRSYPIDRFTPTSVQTGEGEFEIDLLILATGYDAISGALTRLDPVGRAGRHLTDNWAGGPRTYLGMAMTDFPNLFVVQGPQSPSVKYHYALGSELQVDWIAECILRMRAAGYETIEPEPETESAWGAKVADIANVTLYPRTDSWYSGANIPGKPRQFAVHLDGPGYHEELKNIAKGDYTGFRFDRAKSTRQEIA